MSWRDKMKWGDESLKTPEHDALMIWLSENCETICKEIFSHLNFDGFGKAEWEKPLVSKNGSILCFIDLFISAKKQIRKDYIEEQNILFEVKPKIDSIGEVIRQLQSYRHYYSIVDNGWNVKRLPKIVLVSPDTKCKEIVFDNDFIFLNPDDYKESL